MFLLFFSQEEEAGNMFYTCGPNEAMVVSGEGVILLLTAAFTIIFIYLSLVW